jgi:hypothetical protein
LMFMLLLWVIQVEWGYRGPNQVFRQFLLLVSQGLLVSKLI